MSNIINDLEFKLFIKMRNGKDKKDNRKYIQIYGKPLKGGPAFNIPGLWDNTNFTIDNFFEIMQQIMRDTTRQLLYQVDPQWFNQKMEEMREQHERDQRLDI